MFADQGTTQVLMRKCEVHLEERLEHYFEPQLRTRWCSEIIYAVTTLHSLGIVHGDLSPKNVMITADEHVVVGDYDASTPMCCMERGAHVLSLTMPLITQPPELHLGYMYKSGWYKALADTWSTGALLFHIQTGVPLLVLPPDQKWKQFRSLAFPTLAARCGVQLHSMLTEPAAIVSINDARSISEAMRVFAADDTMASLISRWLSYEPYLPPPKWEMDPEFRPIVEECLTFDFGARRPLGEIMGGKPNRIEPPEGLKASDHLIRVATEYRQRLSAIDDDQWLDGQVPTKETLTVICMVLAAGCMCEEYGYQGWKDTRDRVCEPSHVFHGMVAQAAHMLGYTLWAPMTEL